MTVAVSSAVRPRKRLRGATTPRWLANPTIRRRIRRIPGFLLVVTPLLPLLVIVVFGQR